MATPARQQALSAMRDRRKRWRDNNALAGEVVAPVLVRVAPGDASEQLLEWVSHLGLGPRASVVPVAGSDDTQWIATIHDEGTFYVQPLWRLDDTDPAVVETARVCVQDLNDGTGREDFLATMRSLQ